MRVAVKHCGHRISAEWFFESAAPKERENLRRLAFDGRLYRRVMEDGDAVLVPQARKGRFELQRLVDRFVDELLDDVLAPGPERAAPNPPANPLTPAKPMPRIFGVSPSSTATPASTRIFGSRPAAPIRNRDCRARRRRES